jgi:hypothetical protein
MYLWNQTGNKPAALAGEVPASEEALKLWGVEEFPLIFYYLSRCNSYLPSLDRQLFIAPLKSDLLKEAIGNKAYSLLYLQRKQFRIPETFVVLGLLILPTRKTRMPPWKSSGQKSIVCRTIPTSSAHQPPWRILKHIATPGNSNPYPTSRDATPC